MRPLRLSRVSDHLYADGHHASFIASVFSNASKREGVSLIFRWPSMLANRRSDRRRGNIGIIMLERKDEESELVGSRSQMRLKWAH